MAILLQYEIFCMVGVAQLVEHPVVVRDVAGSSPVAHPIFFDLYQLQGQDRRLWISCNKQEIFSNEILKSNFVQNYRNWIDHVVIEN